jgi:calcineurin-like phosphoesterase family protein
MYKHVYDCFKHYYHGGSIYLYSDPHFADEEMKYLRSNYVGDAEQVKRINSKVGKNDTIIFLGDIGDPSFVKHIRGYKVLVMGNHDTGRYKYEPYFDEIYEGPIMLNDRLILSHEPVKLPFAYNIHGHTHSGAASTPTSTCVCAEHIDYTPVHLDNLIRSGVMKNITSIHRITIDNAIERKMGF